MWGLGFRVWDLGFRASGLRVDASGLRVSALALGSLRFRVPWEIKGSVSWFLVRCYMCLKVPLRALVRYSLRGGYLEDQGNSQVRV